MPRDQDIQPQDGISTVFDGTRRNLEGKSVAVRLARMDDIPALWDLGQRFYDECRIGYPPMDRARAQKCAAIAIHCPEIVAIFVAERGGALTGFLICNMLQLMFSTAKVARHDIFYVAPEHRGGRSALLLIRAFEAWGKEHGAARAVISTESGINAPRTERLYLHMGYGPLGGQFGKDL